MPIEVGTASSSANAELSTVTVSRSRIPNCRSVASSVRNAWLVKKLTLSTRSDGTALISRKTAIKTMKATKMIPDPTARLRKTRSPNRARGLVPLLWVLYTVIAKGITAVVSSTWWTHSLQGVLPEQFSGGIYHALYGTLVQSFVAAIIAIPLGLMTAIYLVEYGRGPLAKITTFMVDVLAGVPSIVAALFIFAIWIATFGFQQSAFAVSLALVLLMLPVVIRSTEEMLRLVPEDLREASYALGIAKWTTILRIVLPSALSGIISGILLALARVMGETAGAGPGRLQHLHQLQHPQRQHGLAAPAHLHRAGQPPTRRATARLGRRTHPHPGDRAAQRPGRGGSQAHRPQKLTSEERDHVQTN